MRSTVRYRPCDKRAGRQYREPAVRGRRPHAAQLAGQAHAHETSSARRSFVICAPSRRRQLQRSPSGCVCVRACEARGRAWCVRTHVRTAIRDVCSFLTHEHGHAQRCRVLCRGTTAAALRRRRGTPWSFGPSTFRVMARGCDEGVSALAAAKYPASEEGLPSGAAPARPGALSPARPATGSRPPGVA